MDGPGVCAAQGSLWRRLLLIGHLDLLPANAKVALRLYGSPSPALRSDCQDSELRVPFGPAASNRAVEHACKNCHQNVHGSNAPSGPYLGR